MTQTRTAACRCGQLQAECTGNPVRISICHCLNCQKRSGSAFAAQARWPEAQVSLRGAFKTWSARGDSGRCATFRFCPDCGSTVAFSLDSMPGMIAVATGAFADPTFPAPEISNYESRKHPWLAIVADGIIHN